MRHELEGALLGAEVGHAETRVRVDHRRERDVREVMTLGHHLRPDQDGSIRRRERAKRRGELARLPDRIGVEPEPLQLGNPLLELSLEPLRAGSDPREVDRAARRTRLGRRLGEAAVVAVERVVAVEDERDVAVRAAPRLAAGTAVDRRRDAAPVEQEDRLAASFGQLAELGEERCRERIAGLAAQVDDAHGRQLGADPLAELEPLERRPALRPRRGAAVHGDRSFERGALRGDRPRVVARVGLLLVGRVVLLVDADEPEIRHRREDRRARSDHDRGLTRRDSLALVAPLGVGQRRVQDRDPFTEARPKAPDRLRRERDLWHEHDHAAPTFERRLDRLEVDLRLAASRRSPQQEVAPIPVQSLAQPRQRRLLRLRQLLRARFPGQGVALGGRRRFLPPLALERRDERERPPGCRAVVVGDPERQVDEGRRQLLEHAADRRELDARRRLVFGRDDNASRAAAAERDLDHGALGDALRRVVRERPRERPGREQREDGDRRQGLIRLEAAADAVSVFAM